MLMSGLMLAFLPSGGQWIVIAIIGLLLFGKRLPEVGRSLGKGIVEFQKGLKGVKDDIEQVDEEKETKSLPDVDGVKSARVDSRVDSRADNAVQFKFDPYTGKPLQNAGTTASAADTTKESEKVDRTL